MAEELEGEWVMGWPDRKRARIMPSKDAEGRVIYARSPVLDLEGMLTPTDAYYIVAQLNMPDPVHPDDFSFTIGGMVDNPTEYTLDEIRKLPGRTVRAVTECAGNDGEFFDYIKEGSNVTKPSLRFVQAEEGGWRQDMDGDEKPDIESILQSIPTTCLVSGGEWTGVQFRTVLERAGIQEGAVSVALHGWDEGKPDPVTQYVSVGRTDFDIVDPGIINYDKAMPVEKAMHEDTILAWAHNGEFLIHVHGAPLRLVVPGWCGNWWVKWIDRIEVLDHTPDFYYQTHYFVSGDSPDDPNKKAMTAIGVKTLITSPRDDDGPIKRGTHAVRGRTWSGEGAVVRVGDQHRRRRHLDRRGDRGIPRPLAVAPVPLPVGGGRARALYPDGPRHRRNGARAAGDRLELPAQALRRHHPRRNNRRVMAKARLP